MKEDYPVLKFSRFPKVDGDMICSDIHPCNHEPLPKSGIYKIINRKGKEKLFEIKFFYSMLCGKSYQVLREVKFEQENEE